jgi:NADH:ubiquinone oxidoreductase subunit D
MNSPITPRSTAEFLDGEVAALRGSIDHINDALAENERERDRLRDRRADLARAASEMAVAANVLRASGLRSESRPDGPFVELPNAPVEGRSDETLIPHG